MASTTSVCVVLDGANVSTRKDGQRAIPRLAAAITYFQDLQKTRQIQLRCVAFVPNFWLNSKSTDTGTKGNGTVESEDWELLQSLVNKELVALTPSHAHDDFYVIDYAIKNDGFIVTNDMFRDHVQNQRVFQGRKLTQSWVRSRCIDFTFVGNEFLPNSQAIERAVIHVANPRTAADVAAAPDEKRATPAPISTSKPSATTPRKRPSPKMKTSLTRSLSQSQADDLDDESEDNEANAMAVEHIRKKNVDLSELTPYRVPRHLLPLLKGDDGQTMDRFQEHTNTYIVVPSLGTSPSTKITNVATLSIYGPEANRLHAVKILDAALPELQQQYEYQQHQQWLLHQQQQQQQQEREQQLHQLHQQQLYEQQLQHQQYHEHQHQQIMNEQLYLQQHHLQQQQQMMNEYLLQQQQQQHQQQQYHHHVPAVYHAHPSHFHHHGDGSMDIEPQ